MLLVARTETSTRLSTFIDNLQEHVVLSALISRADSRAERKKIIGPLLLGAAGKVRIGVRSVECGVRSMDYGKMRGVENKEYGNEDNGK